MGPVERHEALFNQEGVDSGDFGTWLATFHHDVIAGANAAHPPSSPTRVLAHRRLPCGDVAQAPPCRSADLSDLRALLTR